MSATCPWCGREHTDVMPLADDKIEMPNKGDVTLCVGCGEWSEFDENAKMVKPSDETIMQLANDPQAAIARTAWLTYKGSENKREDFKGRLKTTFEVLMGQIWREMQVAADYEIDQAYVITEVNFLAAKIAGSIIGNTIGEPKVLDAILPPLVQTIQSTARETQKRKLAVLEERRQ
jgi:hypothetical protein